MACRRLTLETGKETLSTDTTLETASRLAGSGRSVYNSEAIGDQTILVIINNFHCDKLIRNF